MKEKSPASAPSSLTSIGASGSTTPDVDPVELINSNSPLPSVAKLAGAVSETTPPWPMELQKKQESLQWRKFDDPRPYFVVSGLVVNRKGEFILLHRSDKVRSAKNCWSIPSGLHEVGLSMQDQFAQEIREELNLVPVPQKSALIGLYENIRPEKDEVDWHWVISVLVMRVESFTPFINKEPDKHDQVEFVNVVQDWQNRKYHPTLHKFLCDNRRLIINTVQTIVAL